MKHTTQLSIVLLATQKEYQSGYVTACLDKYFKTNASVDKKIDLHIFFNKGEENDYNNLLDYQNCENVNEVKIKSHNLQGVDDLYLRTPQELQQANLDKVPLLGGSNGANNLFFDSMIPLMQENYRDFLMIECDTFPITDYWIDRMIGYCDNHTFMIAGSTYKGKLKLPDFEFWTGHLNGVAIYRASSNLSTFFELSKKTIQYLVSSNQNHFVSFDVGMHHFAHTKIGRKYFNDRNIQQNNLIDSPIISNYSLPQDTECSIEDIKKEHQQTIILHKKPSLKDQQTLLPVYYHIAKNAGTYVLSATSFLLDEYLQSKNKQEDWGKIQAAIDFPSGNKCTVFIGLRNSGVNYWHELYYHSKIASQPAEQLDIGDTYPNNSNWKNLEYAIKLRENAVIALKEKFPEVNTCEGYERLYKETIPNEISKITEQSFSPEDFLEFIQNETAFIFSVLIEPRNSGSSFIQSSLIGWEDNLQFIQKLCTFYNRKPINFLTLREPFSRANSLFHYLISSDSDHELVRDEVHAKTFEEYIDSNELQDSWLVRQLLSLGWHEPINQTHYDLAIKKLEDFHIQDISSVDPLIEKVFLEAYNLSFLQVPKNYLNKNKSSKTNTLKFDQLSPELQQKFLDRTRWDREVYHHFMQ